MAEVRCVVVTPETTVLDETADFVALPLFDGEIAFYPGRAPLIGRLGYGELRLMQGQQARRYYIGGGFVQVAGDVVSVLTEHAVAAGEIDAEVAAERLGDVRSREAHTPELQEHRQRSELELRAQIRVAQRAGTT